MSKFTRWVGKRIGNGPSMGGLKSSVKGTGTLVSTKVAPVVSVVNPALGTTLKVAGELARGKNLKTAALEGVKNYAMGKAGHSIVGKVGGSKLPMVGQHFGGQAAKSAASTATEKVAEAAAPRSKLAVVGDAAKRLLPKTKEGGIDYGGLARTAVGVGTAVEGYQAGKRADKLSDESMRYARENYDANAPLREASRAALLAGPKRPQLDDLFDDGNPYKKRRLPRVGGY